MTFIVRRPNATVSVIVPTKNRYQLLIETLTSISAQTYKNWEAIAIDDWSSEDKVQLVRRYFGADSRIHVHKRKAPNSGAPVCRNEGVELAKGKYVIFLDSDDFLAPFCLEQRVEVMEKNPSVDFGVFPTLVFHETPGDSQILWNINETQDSDIERFLKQDMPW